MIDNKQIQNYIISSLALILEILEEKVVKNDAEYLDYKAYCMREDLYELSNRLKEETK